MIESSPQLEALRSREARQSLAKMLMRLFELWSLSSEEQAAMLGLSPNTRSTLKRYRDGAPLADNRDMLDRAGHLLAIHKSLRILFPHNKSLAYQWPRQPNSNFNEKSPVGFIQDKGFEGLLMIRRYLDFQRGQ